MALLIHNEKHISKQDDLIVLAERKSVMRAMKHWGGNALWVGISLSYVTCKPNDSRALAVFLVLCFCFTFKDDVYAKATHHSQGFPGVESAPRNNFAEKLEMKLLLLSSLDLSDGGF